MYSSRWPHGSIHPSDKASKMLTNEPLCYDVFLMHFYEMRDEYEESGDSCDNDGFLLDRMKDMLCIWPDEALQASYDAYDLYYDENGSDTGMFRDLLYRSIRFLENKKSCQQ